MQKTASLPLRLKGFVFENPFSIILSGVVLYVLAKLAVPVIDWAFVDAVFLGRGPDSCLRPITDAERTALTAAGTLPENGLVRTSGACWPVVYDTANLLIAGRYPLDQMWRPLAALFVPVLLFIGAVRKKIRGIGLPVSLFISVFLMWLLLSGSSLLGLTPVPTERWGGFVLTLLLSLVGIGLGFPLGLLLALARRSALPLFRIVATVYIELIRGVPLVTLLFMGHFMLPLFAPAGTANLNEIMRALTVIVLFQAAYLAEVIRGGLQAIPKGQYEAASALGLGYWKMMSFVILPQALRVSLPPLLNTCIGLVKDTSLVAIIGLFDLLGVARQIATIPQWLGRDLEPLVVAALLYWVVCSALARYSKNLEHAPAVTGGRS